MAAEPTELHPLPARTSTLVIGGGPAGLVALKYAILHTAWDAGEDPVLVEMEEEIGGTFRYRSYEGAELVSSKQLTCFSDFRYPLDAPDHPTLPEFVAYLGAYSQHFGLVPHIHTRSEVVRLSRVGGDYPHEAIVRIRTASGVEEHSIHAKRVVVTTGLHVSPNVPAIPGLNAPPITKEIPHLHSSEYKSRDQLKGKKVLVVGCGETGMDVAHDAVHAARKTWMSVRSGFLSFPKVLNHFRIFGTTFDGNLPIDGLITNLFETTYVHPWVAASHLRWFVSDFVVRRVLWLLTGTSAGCNQWAGELPPERQGRAYVFLNKSAKAMQFINRPFVNMSWLHRMLFSYSNPPPPDVEDPTVHIVPYPERFENGRAIFPPPPAHRSKETAWKEVCDPDLVVLATGYRQDFTWLGAEYARPADLDVRGVAHTSDLSVGYLGFLRPGVGAIPPMAEMQAQLFFLLAEGKIDVPTSPEHYHLLHGEQARIQYGVDYSGYMATLAKDMGAAPSLWALWREYGAFVALVYCFGAAFPSFYRLSGPYKSAKAEGVVKDELWDTIRRRGLAGNIAMGVIPMMFYAAVNAAALALDVIWTLAAPLFGKPKHSVFTTPQPVIQVTPPLMDGVLNAGPEEEKALLPLKDVKKDVVNGFSNGVIRNVTAIQAPAKAV